MVKYYMVDKEIILEWIAKAAGEIGKFVKGILADKLK